MIQNHSKLTRISALSAVAVFGLVAVAGTASAQLSKDDAKCLTSYGKNVAKVAQTAGKEAGGCVKGATKGGSNDVEGCANADAKGKIAKAALKVVDCNLPTLSLPLPTLSLPLPGGDGSAAIAQAIGVDLATALLGNSSLASEKADNKCQGGALKNTSKTFDTKVKEFNKCVKSGGPISDKIIAGDGSDISACLTAANASDKATKAAGKITSDIAKNCGEVPDLSALFPGACAQPALDVATLATCAEGLTDAGLGTFGTLFGSTVVGP